MLLWEAAIAAPVPNEVLRKVIVSAGKNDTWLQSVGADEVVVCHTQEKRCPKRSNKAMDGQAFLSFVTANYERMSQLRIAFVHGGQREWHSAPGIETTIRSGWGREGFIHLGRPSNRRCMDIATTGWCTNILKPQNVSCAMHICTYQGLELMADGVGFLTTTLRQYKGMEDTCNGLDHPPREFGRGYRGCSFAMEYLWQSFAGGPVALSEQHRQEL